MGETEGTKPINCHSIPPKVEGNVNGYLSIKVDEVLWCRKPVNNITVTLSWWGEDSCVKFRPLNVKSVDSIHTAETTYSYEIRTSFDLLRNYLRKCEPLELNVIDNNSNEAVGDVFIYNLTTILRDCQYDSYFPIVNTFGNRVGDLHVCFELQLKDNSGKTTSLTNINLIEPAKLQTDNLSLGLPDKKQKYASQKKMSHSDMKRSNTTMKKSTGVVNQVSKSAENVAVYVNANDQSKCAKEPASDCYVPEILKQKRSTWRSSTTSDVVISKVLKQGQKLRDAMVRSILEDGGELQLFSDPHANGLKIYDSHVQVPIGKAGPALNNSKVISYLLGQYMNPEEKEAALMTLRTMSPVTSLLDMAIEDHIRSEDKAQIPLEEHHKDNPSCESNKDSQSHEGSSCSFSGTSSDGSSVGPGPRMNTHRQKRSKPKGSQTVSEMLLSKVNCIRISVHTLQLSYSGLKRVFVSGGHLLPHSVCRQLPPGAVYFAEFELPPQLTSFARNCNRLWNSKTKRFCSKKQVGQVIYFGQNSIHTLPNKVDMVQKLQSAMMTFQIYSRHLNQRIPSMIGLAELEMGSMLNSKTLSTAQKLSIKPFQDTSSRNNCLGHLSVKAELGADRSHFGRDLVKISLANSQEEDFVDDILEDISDASSEKKKNNRKNRAVHSESNKFYHKNGNHKHNHKSKNKVHRHNVKNASGPEYRKSNNCEVPKTGTALSTDSSERNSGGDQQNQSTGESGAEEHHTCDSEGVSRAIVKEPRLLLVLLHIAEGRGFGMVNSFLVCRAFWKEDIMTSDVSWGTDHPRYNFHNVLPVLLSSEFLSRTRDSWLVTEVWEQGEGRPNSLVGIAKLPVNQFYVAYRDPQVASQLIFTKYPVISVDGWVSVVNPITQTPCGQIHVLLALGTEDQVRVLEITRGLREELYVPAPAPPSSLSDSRAAVSEPGHSSYGVVHIAAATSHTTLGSSVSAHSVCPLGGNCTTRQPERIEQQKVAAYSCDVLRREEYVQGVYHRQVTGTNCQVPESVGVRVAGTTWSRSGENVLSAPYNKRTVPSMKYNVAGVSETSSDNDLSVDYKMKCDPNQQQSYNNQLQCATGQLASSHPNNIASKTQKNQSSQTDLLVLDLTKSDPSRIPTMLMENRELNIFYKELATHLPTGTSQNFDSHNAYTSECFPSASGEEVSQPTGVVSQQVRLSEDNVDSQSLEQDKINVDTLKASSSDIISEKTDLRFPDNSDPGGKSVDHEDAMFDSCFRAYVEIDQAMHLPSACEYGTYVSFELLCRDRSKSSTEELVVTSLVPLVSCPRWEEYCNVWLPAELLSDESKRLVLKVWRAEATEPDPVHDTLLGFAAIDLTVLLFGLPCVSGWFHIQDYANQCHGQLKATVSPLEDVSRFISNISPDVVFDGSCWSEPGTDHPSKASVGDKLNVKHPGFVLHFMWPVSRHSRLCAPATGAQNRTNQATFAPDQAGAKPSTGETAGAECVPGLANSAVDGLPDDVTSALSASLQQKLSELEVITERLKQRLSTVTKDVMRSDFFQDDDMCMEENDYPEYAGGPIEANKQVPCISDGSSSSKLNPICQSQNTGHTSPVLYSGPFKYQSDLTSSLDFDVPSKHSESQKQPLVVKPSTNTFGEKDRSAAVRSNPVHPRLGERISKTEKDCDHAQPRHSVEKGGGDFNVLTNNLMSYALEELEIDNVFNPLLFQHLLSGQMVPGSIVHRSLSESNLLKTVGIKASKADAPNHKSSDLKKNQGMQSRPFSAEFYERCGDRCAEPPKYVSSVQEGESSETAQHSIDPRAVKKTQEGSSQVSDAALHSSSTRHVVVGKTNSVSTVTDSNVDGSNKPSSGNLENGEDSRENEKVSQKQDCCGLLGHRPAVSSQRSVHFKADEHIASTDTSGKTCCSRHSFGDSGTSSKELGCSTESTCSDCSSDSSVLVVCREAPEGGNPNEYVFTNAQAAARSASRRPMFDGAALDDIETLRKRLLASVTQAPGSSSHKSSRGASKLAPKFFQQITQENKQLPRHHSSTHDLHTSVDQDEIRRIAKIFNSSDI